MGMAVCVPPTAPPSPQHPRTQARNPVTHTQTHARTQYVPSTAATSLIVGVRVRPLLKNESALKESKDILRVLDNKVRLVLLLLPKLLLSLSPCCVLARSPLAQGLVRT